MQIFINNWSSRLDSPLTSASLEMLIAAEDAARLVGIGAGDHYLLTLVAVDSAGVETAHEIVRVTAVAGSALTIERAQEGTPAAEWPISTLIEARFTAGAAAAIAAAAANAVQSDDLASVAISGAYADLAGTPAIPSTPAEVGAATAAQGALAETAVQPGSLAAVATSGAYADLTGAPAIPVAAGDVGAIPIAEKGAANGVATLGADSKIPLTQLPAAAITDTFVVNTEAAMLSLAAQVGDVAIRPDITSSFILQADPASALGNWQQIVTPSIGGGAPVGSATPQNLGAASPGVSGNASREDHVHAMPSAGDVGAAPVGHVGDTGTAHGVATTSVAGFMAAADKSKLDGVATGATANSSDATLLARANHTGEQAISTVTGLQAALDKALFAPVVTEAGTARTSLLSDAGSYLRFTSTSAKAYTVEPQASVAWVADSEIHGRNAGTGDLTLTAGSGVTLNAPFGGTLVIPTGGSFTLKRGAENVWDVIGQTEASA